MLETDQIVSMATFVSLRMRSEDEYILACYLSIGPLSALTCMLLFGLAWLYLAGCVISIIRVTDLLVDFSDVFGYIFKCT